MKAKYLLPLLIAMFTSSNSRGKPIPDFLSTMSFPEKKSIEQVCTPSYPELSYVHLFSPEKAKAFYYRLRGNWKTIESSREESVIFSGIACNLNVGYEMDKPAPIRQTIDLNLSNPALPFSQDYTLFYPSVELSYSVDF